MADDATDESQGDARTADKHVKPADGSVVKFAKTPLPRFRLPSSSTGSEQGSDRVKFTKSRLVPFQHNTASPITFGTSPQVEFTFQMDPHSPKASSVASKEVRFTPAPLPVFRPQDPLSTDDMSKLPRPHRTSHNTDQDGLARPSLPAVHPHDVSPPHGRSESTSAANHPHTTEMVTFTRHPLPTFRPRVASPPFGRSSEAQDKALDSRHSAERGTFTTAPLPAFRAPFMPSHVGASDTQPAGNNRVFASAALPRFGAVKQHIAERRDRVETRTPRSANTDPFGTHAEETGRDAQPHGVHFRRTPLPVFGLRSHPVSIHNRPRHVQNTNTGKVFNESDVFKAAGKDRPDPIHNGDILGRPGIVFGYGKPHQCEGYGETCREICRD
ncbi:hypothetical protein BDW22DRAFT_1346358 [Trametopsis cervina]|nr:hypothetical protein BDW22DRAFT_1346358 [Trametopsis cervina]